MEKGWCQMSDESMELLRKELETFDKDKLRHLLEQFVGAKEAHKPRHGMPISYTSVTRHYTCLLCGATFTRTDKFGKDETITTVDKKGGIHTVRMTGKAGEVEIPATTNRCSYCCTRMKEWTREELEQRFITLADMCSHKEIGQYSEWMKVASEASITTNVEA